VVYDGSPAQLYGLHPLNWITEANDVPITDLDSFLSTVSKIPTDSFVRLKLMSYNRFAKVISIRTNAHYFGSWQSISTSNIVQRNVTAKSGWSLETL
jgi:pro-apoptotic serine protease NMA111